MLPNLQRHLGHHDLVNILAELTEIPRHDPSRYETTDGFENPRCTNGNRALLAENALKAFQVACGMDEDVETAASDLICDLLHLLHANDRDPIPVFRNGIHGFLCEAGEITLAPS
jgi:hypothetical protein